MNVGLSQVISLPKGASVTFLSEASQHSPVAQQESVPHARCLQAPSGGPRRVISVSSLRRRVTGRAKSFRNNFKALRRDKYRQGWLSQLCDKETELREAESQIAELREKAEKLKAREQKYRHVFLKNVGPPKINDDDMQQAFAKLKQRLQIVARNKVLDLRLPRRRLLRSASGKTKTMYDPFSSADDSLRPLILQAELFDLLFWRILRVNHFGVGQALNATQSQPRFKDTMELDEEVIADWRLSTIKCIELSGMGQPDETAATGAMLKKLTSFMPENPDVRAVHAIETDVQLLCEAAYDFRLMMRKSKDIYTCFFVPEGEPWHEQTQKAAEAFAEQPGGSSGQVVACTSWGGLIKHAKFRGEEPVVLQKAQVILAAA
ncbi:hypothetical protein AAL_02606 [Moelleriella libera RCEF 2490]|uniref:Uncharacterized protein n=1 Tax=Moelleriella libera RCEF 2490 TaxID=1081109 RepID=A0A168EQR4_9HYPO|nr:hypothetical protein AAL_02606 [Moelleriella libera RCEF 2490]